MANSKQKSESIHPIPEQNQLINQEKHQKTQLEGQQLKVEINENEKLMGPKKIGKSSEENIFEAERESNASKKKSRKRKSGRKGNDIMNEEPKDGGKIFEEPINGRDGVKRSGGDIKVEGRSGGVNEDGLGNNISEFVKELEQSGSGKKKKRRRKKRNGEIGELKSEDVKKDDGKMVEVRRDENKGEEGGDGTEPERKKPKKGGKETVVFKCFVCDATDHNAKYCPRKSEWFKTKICLICRREGHNLGSCPEINYQSCKQSASETERTNHQLSKSSQPLEDVSATKQGNRSQVTEEKAIAREREWRKKKKESQKQKKLEAKVVENLQD